MSNWKEQQERDRNRDKDLVDRAQAEIDRLFSDLNIEDVLLSIKGSVSGWENGELSPIKTVNIFPQIIQKTMPKNIDPFPLVGASQSLAVLDYKTTTHEKVRREFLGHQGTGEKRDLDWNPQPGVGQTYEAYRDHAETVQKKEPQQAREFGISVYSGYQGTRLPYSIPIEDGVFAILFKRTVTRNPSISAESHYRSVMGQGNARDYRTIGFNDARNQLVYLGESIQGVQPAQAHNQIDRAMYQFVNPRAR